jgi:hypothetical protein
LEGGGVVGWVVVMVVGAVVGAMVEEAGRGVLLRNTMYESHTNKCSRLQATVFMEVYAVAYECMYMHLYIQFCIRMGSAQMR